MPSSSSLTAYADTDVAITAINDIGRAVFSAVTKADGEDEVAGTGLLAGGRRRRQPQTTTRPVPARVRPAQAATSWTLTRPCTQGSCKVVRQAVDLHGCWRREAAIRSRV